MDSTDVPELQKLTYRELQKVSKELRLPSNVKKIYLIQLIYAKTHCTESVVNEILEKVKSERLQAAKNKKVKKNNKRKPRAVTQSYDVSSSRDSVSPSLTVTPTGRKRYTIRPFRTDFSETERVLRNRTYSIHNAVNKRVITLKSFNNNSLQYLEDSLCRVTETRPMMVRKSNDNSLIKKETKGTILKPIIIKNTSLIRRMSVEVQVKAVTSQPQAKKVRTLSGITPLCMEENKTRDRPTLQIVQRSNTIHFPHAVQRLLDQKNSHTCSYPSNNIKPTTFGIMDRFRRTCASYVVDLTDDSIETQTVNSGVNHTSNTKTQRMVQERKCSTFVEKSTNTVTDMYNKLNNDSNVNTVKKSYNVKLNNHPNSESFNPPRTVQDDVSNVQIQLNAEPTTLNNTHNNTIWNVQVNENKHYYTNEVNTNANWNNAQNGNTSNTQDRTQQETDAMNTQDDYRGESDITIEGNYTNYNEQQFTNGNYTNCNEQQLTNGNYNNYNEQQLTNGNYTNYNEQQLTNGNYTNYNEQQLTNGSYPNMKSAFEDDSNIAIQTITFIPASISNQQLTAINVTYPAYDNNANGPSDLNSFSNQSQSMQLQSIWTFNTDSKTNQPACLGKTYNSDNNILYTAAMQMPTECTNSMPSRPCTSTTNLIMPVYKCEDNNLNLANFNANDMLHYQERDLESERRGIMRNPLSFLASQVVKFTEYRVTGSDMDDALEVISQDGDYMSKSGMNAIAKCVFCSWEGVKIQLDNHFRKEHADEMQACTTEEWVIVCSLLEVLDNENWVPLMVEDKELELYLLYVKFEEPSWLVVAPFAVTSDFSTKQAEITVHNKDTAEPYVWKGEVQEYTSSWVSSEKDFRIDLTKIHSEFIFSGRNLIGRPWPDNTNLAFFVRVM